MRKRIRCSMNLLIDTGRGAKALRFLRAGSDRIGLVALGTRIGERSKWPFNTLEQIKHGMVAAARGRERSCAWAQDGSAVLRRDVVKAETKNRQHRAVRLQSGAA